MSQVDMGFKVRVYMVGVSSFKLLLQTPAVIWSFKHAQLFGASKHTYFNEKYQIRSCMRLQILAVS